MQRWEVRFLGIAITVVSLSGVLYFWMKYFLVNDDPFSVVNHPWQSSTLALHLIAAPVLVFAVGWIGQSHIRKKLAGGLSANRRSGLVSTAVLPVMILSGYGLQVVSHPFWAQVILVSHIASSLVFMVTYLSHQIVSLRIRRATFSGLRMSPE